MEDIFHIDPYHVTSLLLCFYTSSTLFFYLDKKAVAEYFGKEKGSVTGCLSLVKFSVFLEGKVHFAYNLGLIFVAVATGFISNTL